MENLDTTSSNQPTNNDTNESNINFNQRLDLDKIKNGVLENKNQLSKVIVCQEEFIDLLIVSIFANGHVLIEGVPGVAKTITAKLLAKTMDVEFNRIQFTPDLMPSDVLGTSIFNMKTNEFEYKKGPDRKSTRLNSSHVAISYAVFCLKKKMKKKKSYIILTEI